MKKIFTTYFFVNNIKISNIEKNRNIIDYLENLNIKIPHYCYHPKLSVSGNCRMCLIELKNSPKPLISCAMTVINNMEIYTDSPLVKKARENILEFLLLNHPLDCPVCDQGGECDLQDQSFIFGSSNKRFFNYKRSVTNKNLGPIVKTVMTRCIHCTRCVRFAIEIADVPDLGMYGRGYNSEIGTYILKALDSELSGNIIDICPVGALTNKPYSFIDRSWELNSMPSIDCTDGFGENITILVKNTDTITKIYPCYSKKTFSNSWITNKTRFCFDGMFTSERVLDFSISNLHLEKSTWQNIFIEVINTIYFQIHLNKLRYLTNNFNILVGENIDLEFLTVLLLLKQQFSFVKLCKLKENNFFLDQEQQFLTNNISDNCLKQAANCLLIGINTRLESPFLNIILKQRFLKGDFNIYAINSFLNLKLSYHCLGNNLQILKSISEGTHPICQKLKQKAPTIVIYNSSILKHSLVNNFFKTFSKYLTSNFILFNSFNFINKSLSESTLNYVGNLTNLTFKNFKNSLGLYLINISKKENFFKKLITFKLLKMIHTDNNKIFNNILLNQTHTNNISEDLLKHFKIYITLPNTSFYENSSFFVNSEGYLKKSIKAISSKKFSKKDSDILNKFFLFLNKELNKTTKKLNNNLNFKQIPTYFLLNFYPLFNATYAKQFLIFKKSFLNLNLKNSKISFLKKKNLTKTYLWLDDFYIGGKDLYSIFSKVMVECSKLSRIRSLNFNFLN